MYRATLTSDFFLADYKVPTGEVLLEDVTASSVLLLRCGTVEPYIARDNPPILEGSTVLIIRPGGYGDLLFLTPIILHLTGLGAIVTVSAHTRFHCILEGQPCLMAPYPMLEQQIDAYDCVFWMENAVEDSSDQTHIVDLFAKRVGVEVEDKHCRYSVTDEERDWAAERLPRGGKPRIGIQAKASAECRSYPERPMMGVASMLIERGFEVVLFGAPGTINAHPSYICLPAWGVSMRQSAAILEQCDACIAPDSAICHLAGALRVPTVALYGPFPREARTKYHPSIFALTGQAPCAPCFHHARVEPWVLGKPCSTAHHCVALGSIPPEKIVQKVEQMVLR